MIDNSAQVYATIKQFTYNSKVRIQKFKVPNKVSFAMSLRFNVQVSSTIVQRSQLKIEENCTDAIIVKKNCNNNNKIKQ